MVSDLGAGGSLALIAVSLVCGVVLFAWSVMLAARIFRVGGVTFGSGVRYGLLCWGVGGLWIVGVLAFEPPGVVVFVSGWVVSVLVARWWFDVGVGKALGLSVLIPLFLHLFMVLAYVVVLVVVMGVAMVLLG